METDIDIAMAAQFEVGMGDELLVLKIDNT